MAAIYECYDHCGYGLLNVLILILNIWLFGYPETILPTLSIILIQVHIYLSIHCTCCGRSCDTILTHLVNNTVLWTIAVMDWYLVLLRIGRIVKRFGSRADLVIVVSLYQSYGFTALKQLISSTVVTDSHTHGTPHADSHYKNTMVLRTTYLYNGNPIPQKTIFILRRGPDSVRISCHRL